MNSGEKKIALLLSKVREEWDLISKKEDESFRFQTGFSYHEDGIPMTLSSKKYSQWMRECGIDDHTQFTNILELLKEKGLILSFEFLDESR
jgi:hypothetical protein